MLASCARRRISRSSTIRSPPISSPTKRFVREGQRHCPDQPRLARCCDDVGPGGLQLVVIGCLIVPAPAARALAVGLYNFLDQHGASAERDGIAAFGTGSNAH
ncbi:hypothetical protein [Sphingosinicella sp. BN140058]|uniref:hypothetical protein n=1 Tax=Sphingosinicella sp. BN140058 TaxID=1892855 RepID=UPI001013558A|nr:hypothetical protein [Sphingosinicella sp. BN140058]QAY76397.1 hypothetical protein ETR14_07755 [Sphingosinicella sp. BN140058]